MKSPDPEWQHFAPVGGWAAFNGSSALTTALWQQFPTSDWHYLNLTPGSSAWESRQDASMVVHYEGGRILSSCSCKWVPLPRPFVLSSQTSGLFPWMRPNGEQRSECSQGAAVCACTTAEGKRSDRPPKSLRRTLPQRGLLTWTHASSGHHRRLSKHKPPLLRAGQPALTLRFPLRLPRDPSRGDVPQAGDVFPAPHCDIEHEHHEQRDDNIGPELDIAAGLCSS
jgi:hypothetical protein